MRVACYRNFAACFQRVLVDGGKHRIFSAEDKQIFDDDFCAIKAEVHRLEDLMDVDAMERLMTLLSMETADLIGLYLLRAIFMSTWGFWPAVFRPFRTVFPGLGAGFLNLGGKTEGTAKKRGKNEQKWARNGLRRVGVGGNHYCAEQVQLDVGCQGEAGRPALRGIFSAV